MYVPNVTAHPSTARVPITGVLLYNDQLLCGFNMPFKGLRQPRIYDEADENDDNVIR